MNNYTHMAEELRTLLGIKEKPQDKDDGGEVRGLHADVPDAAQDHLCLNMNACI
jgi:hypothetical protein